MTISLPECDIADRLPSRLTNAVCVRCAKNLAGGTGPRRWVYCDRREAGKDKPARPLSNPRGQATAEHIASMGRYTLGRELGRGGMGLVLAARDTVLDRDVALKVQISGPSASETARKRFEQELKTLATLQVDGVARVLDGGVTDDGMTWYVMEQVEGPNLAEVLRDAFALPREEALRIVQRLARTLTQLHQKNVAHRDIKPSNILISLSGDPILVDFGLVTSLQRLEQGAERLTVDLVGTPRYMAPEQNTSEWEQIDWVRVDVYALGMVLIECLTGTLPPVANPTLELLPARLRQLCTRATHPDPRHRFATPGELADAIDGVLRGGFQLSPTALRWAAGIAGAATLALALPSATLLSTWRAERARETVAEERLTATWERIDSLNPDDPDVEATFRAFVDDASNHGTDAYHRAWRRRAESSDDRDVQIESWATAWLTATRRDARSESLRGLVDAFVAHGRWRALDALLVDTTDESLADAGLDGQELRIRAALYARRFDEAVAKMEPDDPRRGMALHYRTATRVPELDDVLLVRPSHGWVCGPDACIHPDGRSVPGPIDINLDGGHLGPLFHRQGQGLFRPDNSVLCELDLPHLLDGTEWNGQVAVAAGGHHPQVLLIDPETCEVSPLPIVNGGLDSWVSAIHSVDLDNDGADELVAAVGPSFGYGMRAISSDGQRVLDDITLGNARDFVPVEDDQGIHFVVALSDFHVSPYFFPDGAISGVVVVRWADDGFGEPELLPHRLAPRFDSWLADSGDIDGDGDLDITATHTLGDGSLTIWVDDEGEYKPSYIGLLSSVFLRQLDDDPAVELIATAAGEGWILGLGDDLLPFEAPPAPLPEDTRPVFARALRLRQLGLLRRSAEEAERAARTLAFTDAIDAWELAAQSWLDAGEPELAAQAYGEAARIGATDASQKALDAYVAGWALGEAREFAIRAGLTTRAPMDHSKLDFSDAPDAGMWLAPGVATWSSPRDGVVIDAINGVEDVLRFEVERRSDLFGARVDLTAERLEWGAGISLVLSDAESSSQAEVRMDAHGGDGELYRRISSSFHAQSIPDPDPNGPHDTSLTLAYDRQSRELHAEGWVDGERLISHEKHYSLQGDHFIVSIRVPHHEQVDGAAIRAVVRDIELYGLVPTGRVLEPIEQTGTIADAYHLLPIRRNPDAPEFKGVDGHIRDTARVFESQLAMHPSDGELNQKATSQLGILGTQAAIDQAPMASVLYADALVASGRTRDAEAVYWKVVDSPDAHASALAWAGLADTASIRGDDPSNYLQSAINKAPAPNVGLAWLRRRRLGHLVD